MKILNVHDLFAMLTRRGYRYCRPRSRTWFSAFVLKRKASVLCILVRKNGIDVRYYEEYQDEIAISDNNIASIRGGELFRNHYNEAETLLTQKIAALARAFSQGVVLPEMRKEDGRSYLLNSNYQDMRKESMAKFKERFVEMKSDAIERSISKYISEDCGGYLGDGEWM